MAENFSDFSSPRVNASMFQKYQGKKVCLLGIAKDINGNGTSFTITACDGKDVPVTMREPLSEFISGLTEVEGLVQGNQILCDNYILFSTGNTHNFDGELYSKAIDLADRFPEYYVGLKQQ